MKQSVRTRHSTYRFDVRNTGAGWVVRDNVTQKETTQTWNEGRAMLEATRLTIGIVHTYELGWRAV